ncbi:MAG: AAA family ATPase [Chitinophagaceae bacterium]
MIIIVMGLPGSGKSFFATRLAAAINADYISSDRQRKKMIANRTYSANEKELVYNEMLMQMRQAIKQNRNLVLDATFHKNETRNKFKEEAGNTDEIIFIEIIANETLVKERLRATREDSEADFAVHQIIRQEWQPMKQLHLTLQSTNDNIEDMLEKTIEYLNQKQ